MREVPTQDELQARVARFNDHRPEAVVYSSSPSAEKIIAKVDGDAYVLGGHTAVVQLVSVSGCVALDAVRTARSVDYDQLRTAEAVLEDRRAYEARDDVKAYKVFWSEMSRAGDPARVPNMALKAFLAGWAACRAGSDQ